MGAAFLAGAWLLGLAAAAYTGADTPAIAAAAGLFAPVSYALRPRLSTLLVIPLAIALIPLAFWRYDATQPDPTAGVGALNNVGEVNLRAVVDGEPRDRQTSRTYELRVTQVLEHGRWDDASGRVLMRSVVFSSLRRGDLIEVRGDLEDPPAIGSFDYSAYLLRRDITSIVNYPKIDIIGHKSPGGIDAAMASLRAAISGDLSTALPEPQASLASGVLLGAGGRMPDGLQRDMSATGTSHLVAVSGQNVSLLAGLIIAAFAWVIGRRPAAGTAMVAIVGYSVLVGAQPSVIRSAIMGGLYILAIASGRQATAPLALIMAAAVMTAVDPQVVHEISFQLSFAATLGLVTLAPLLAQHMWALAARSRPLSTIPWTRALTDMFAVSLSASLFTVPISAITFGNISLISPLANLFITPAFLAVAATSAIAAGLVAVLPASTTVAAWIAWPPAEYMVQAAGWFASIPFASANISQVASTETAIPWYLALFGFTAWLSKRRVPEEPVDHFSLPLQRLAPALGLTALAGLAAILAWHTLAYPHEGRVSLTVLDVGQGEAILVEDAVGHRVLIDGGPNSQGIREALSRHLPFDDRRIDVVVLTHPQADHLTGLLEVIGSYNVSTVLDSSASVGSALRNTWVGSLAGSVPTVSTASRGQRIELAGGTLDVLAPTHDPAYKTLDLNDHSTILRLSVGKISFLLTGDLGKDGEQVLMRSGADIHADVLKVGHHGSRFSSSPEFLSQVDPSVSLISVGTDNPYGLPSQEVIGRLDESLLYRTDESGDITVSTEGTRLWIETER